MLKEIWIEGEADIREEEDDDYDVDEGAKDNYLINHVYVVEALLLVDKI